MSKHLGTSARGPVVPRASRGRGRFARTDAAADTPASQSPLLESSAPSSTQARDQLFRRALVCADVIAALAVVGLARLAFGGLGAGWYALLLPLAVPFVYTASGLYRRDELVINRNTLDEAPGIFQAATLTAVLTYLVESALVRTPLGAQLIGLTIVSLTVLTMLLRMIARASARRLSPTERCLVVGGADVASRLESQLRTSPAVKAELVGRLPFAAAAEFGQPAFSSHTDLSRAVLEREVDRVVIAGDNAPPESVHEAIHAAKAIGVKVSLLPRMFEVVGSSVTFDYLGGLTVLGVRRFGLSRRARFVKRAFDVVGSALLLALGSLAMIVIAFAIRFDSSGPVLFRQTRIGRDGKPFAMLKFRSMRCDAERLKDQLRNRSQAEGLFKIPDDPRITAVGRLLRRTSLDELPQLLNVIRGEMSLVGPRPLVPDEDRQIQSWHRRRLALTPGMTGAWQVLGSARIPLREMVIIDYLYVANWSLWGDIKLLLRTVGAVLARRGC